MVNENRVGSYRKRMDFTCIYYRVYEFLLLAKAKMENWISWWWIKWFECFVLCVYNHENFYQDIYSIKSDLELLKYIIDHFKSFDDKNDYKGKTIHFNKRATLLANDLFYVSQTIQKTLDNVNHLSGCEDYSVPRTFRDYDILEYSSDYKI